MKSTTIQTKSLFLFISVMMVLPLYLSSDQNENGSFKLSFGTNFTELGDINTWIDSLNSFWTDWRALAGGNLSGEFDKLSRKLNIEGELRVNIYSGLAFHFAASSIRTKKESTISFRKSEGNQKAVHFLLNEIKAIPIKIGLSYMYPLNARFNIFANAGRQIIFVQYNTKENYEFTQIIMGTEFAQWHNKDDKFRSEALGFYFAVGFEYNINNFLSVGIEGENIWSNVSGFKGEHLFENHQDASETGNASLYYYQIKYDTLTGYYNAFTGHEEKPEGSEFKDVRQGEIDFSGFSLKLGIRFRF